MDLTWQTDFIIRLALAAVCGGAIGLEREIHGRYAGLRTNMLVCVGACLLMMVSLHLEQMFAGLDDSSVVRLDPGRIASYAIAGMGFIGAGAIIKGRGSIRGLTTAATLWLLTGIGLAVGSGFYIPALLTTGVTVAILYLSRKHRMSREVYTTLKLRFDGTANRLKHIRDILDQYPRISIVFINYNVNLVNDTANYRLFLATRDNARFGMITGDLMCIPGLEELTWEAGQVP